MLRCLHYEKIYCKISVEKETTPNVDIKTINVKKRESKRETSSYFSFPLIHNPRANCDLARKEPLKVRKIEVVIWHRCWMRGLALPCCLTVLMGDPAVSSAWVQVSTGLCSGHTAQPHILLPCIEKHFLLLIPVCCGIPLQMCSSTFFPHHPWAQI